MLGDDVAVVFLACATEEFERHDQEDDADAGAGEGPSGVNVPGAGEEASVDCVPVPQHLGMG